jgi:hypothetical protein
VKAGALWLAMLVPLAASAQVYKWVDEKGRTHYSETPPREGAKPDKVDIRPGSEAPPLDWKQKELESRERRILKEQEEHRQKSADEKAARNRKSTCLEARRHLARLQAQRPVYNLNSRGEKVYVEDKDRLGEIERLGNVVANHCN